MVLPVELTIEDVKVDPEFRDLCPKLREEERTQLLENLRAEGCRDPLVVWNGTLLDGHNRLGLCRELGITPRIVTVALDSREAAVDWIIKNQLGRRNLTPAKRAYLLGKRYNLEKAAHGGARARGHDDPLNTAERIGREQEVAPKTVKRAGKYTRGLDRAEAIRPGIRAAIQEGAIDVGQGAVAALADVPDEELPAAVAALQDAPPKTIAQVVTCNLSELEPVDAVIAEFPWSSFEKAQLEELGQVAARALPPGGSLLVAVDKRHEAEAREVLRKSLRSHYALTRVNKGPATRVTTGVKSRCSAVLWFVNKEYTGPDLEEPLEAGRWDDVVRVLVKPGGTACLVGTPAEGLMNLDIKLVEVRS